MLGKRNMLQINKSNTAVCKIFPPRKYSFMNNKALLLLKISLLEVCAIQSKEYYCKLLQSGAVRCFLETCLRSEPCVQEI